MDAHLVMIPGLGTLTTRSLAASDSQLLGWDANRSLDAKVLVLGTFDELTADLLKDLDISRRESDSDLGKKN